MKKKKYIIFFLNVLYTTAIDAPTEGGETSTSVGPLKEKPSNHDVQEKPPNYDVQEKSPNYDAQEKPPNYNVKEKPANYDIQEKPPNYDVQEKPSNHDAQEKPPNHDVQEKPPNYDVHEKPSNHDVQEKPPNYDIQDKAHNHDVQDKPPNYDVQEKRPNYDVQEKRRNYDVQEKPRNHDAQEIPPNYDIQEIPPNYEELGDLQEELKNYDVQDPFYEEAYSTVSQKRRIDMLRMCSKHCNMSCGWEDMPDIVATVRTTTTMKPLRDFERTSREEALKKDIENAKKDGLITRFEVKIPCNDPSEANNNAWLTHNINKVQALIPIYRSPILIGVRGESMSGLIHLMSDHKTTEFLINVGESIDVSNYNNHWYNYKYEIKRKSGEDYVKCSEDLTINNWEWIVVGTSWQYYDGGWPLKENAGSIHKWMKIEWDENNIYFRPYSTKSIKEIADNKEYETIGSKTYPLSLNCSIDIKGTTWPPKFLGLGQLCGRASHIDYITFAQMPGENDEPREYDYFA